MTRIWGQGGIMLKMRILIYCNLIIISHQIYADNQAHISIPLLYNTNDKHNILKTKKNYAYVKKEGRTTTFMTYISAVNDLFPFAGRNLKQMQNIGSNERLTITAHFDMHRPGQPKLTRRFLIGKNKLIQIGPDYSMDSGEVNTLTSFCKWAIESYPADDYILVLWNHGTGILEPIIKRAINPAQLFTINPTTKLIELNRSISFFDFIKEQNALIKPELRGICFDDTTGNYLTNQKLKEALHIITNDYLKGNKLSLIGFDACLMSMIEVASIVKDYAHIMVSSQEVELGTGWPYAEVLAPYLTHSPDTITFAKHIVTSFDKAYSKITNDFTQSALDLAYLPLIEQNVDKLSLLLIKGLKNQKNKTVKESIRLSRHKNFCTHFDETTYLDYKHLLTNLYSHIHRYELKTPQETTHFRQELTTIIKEGLKLINQVVIENAMGKNLQNAGGISIYLPEYQIHSSYRKSEFANNTHWLAFLIQYLTS